MELKLIRHRNDNMLLRIAQGDAFAAAVEYVKRKEHAELYSRIELFETYEQHPTHRGLRPGMYTDDTQMSIAVAEALIQHPDDMTNESFAERFYQAFKRDPRDGYSRGFQAILEESKSSSHLRQLLRPDSTKNGAAMRAVPIGVVKDPKKLISIASTQATVTHATWGGVNSAVSVALMSHFALYDRRDFSSMHQWCCGWSDAHKNFYDPWKGPVGGKGNDPRGLETGMNTAWAVQTLLTTEGSLRDIMKRCIEWGGDTDSVASIAFGIASARYQNETLPIFLERDLEPNGQFGVAYLKDLGKQLMDAYADGPACQLNRPKSTLRFK